MKFNEDTIKKNITAFFDKIGDPTGRTSRDDFWMTMIILIIANFILGIVLTIIGSIIFLPVLFNLITSGISLITLIATISLQIRRLHDVGISGNYAWLNIVPLIGQIILFLYFIKPGDESENSYGMPTAL